MVTFCGCLDCLADGFGLWTSCGLGTGSGNWFLIGLLGHGTVHVGGLYVGGVVIGVGDEAGWGGDGVENEAKMKDRTLVMMMIVVVVVIE